ncbi:MAG: hypothetical protein LBL15_04665, partial [Oscillospiraceae bacterium]|nr:hypothetical protein [Oscillospiraceae bacterium]
MSKYHTTDSVSKQIASASALFTLDNLIKLGYIIFIFLFNRIIFRKWMEKMKGDITLALIAQTAGDIADDAGFENLSIKAVAEKLGIKSPSLIFHVKSLNGLKSLLGQYTAKLFVAELLRAGFGKSRLEAVSALGKTSVKFAVRHPG